MDWETHISTIDTRYKIDGLPRWLSGKESACQYRSHRRCRFDPWARKIPWKKACQPTPVFLSGKSHGQRSMRSYSPLGCKNSWICLANEKQLVLKNKCHLVVV